MRSFDYASGGTFFITICTYQKRCIFGDVADGAMQLSDIGRIADAQWRITAAIRTGVVLDEFGVMPNHVHAVVFVPPSPKHDGGAAPRRAPRSLASLVGGYKSAVTSAVRRMLGDPAFEVWQPRFYEHGIRTQPGLERARRYVRENPARWDRDRENPNRKPRRRN
jgi:hypothetical protein